MPTTSIRIDGTVLIVLRELARQQHQSIQTVLATAIETYRRQRILEDANAAFAALRENPETWAEEKKERELWDRAITDGVDRE